MKKTTYIPGLTLRSFFASIFCMLAMAMITQYGTVVVAVAYGSEITFPVPALLVFLIVSTLVSLVAALTKFRLLSKQELLCILFAMMMSTPIMIQGFWHRVVSICGTLPREKAFDKMDAFDDKLWPHGENLVPDALEKSNALKSGSTFKGKIDWERVEFEKGAFGQLPRLSNTSKGDISSISIKIPLEKNGKKNVVASQPHMISMLARSKDLGEESFFFCYAYSDDNPQFQVIFNSREAPQKTMLHQMGFVRVGSYGTVLSTDAKDSITLEFGLSGKGSVEIYDPKVYNVSVLEDFYKGKRYVLRSEYNRLPENERIGLIAKPDNMWSLDGLIFLLTGYIPIKAWLTPVFTWGWLIVLVLVGTIAINVIMRKQWCENERFPLPMTKVPLALLENERNENSVWPGIWTNRMMWIGFAISIAWCLLKGMYFYNTAIPNLSINIPVATYLNDPAWGGMWWGVDIRVYALILGLCLLMELNVLISIPIGYLAFQALGWFGSVTGFQVIDGYPFRSQQMVGSILMYGLATLFFVRKYIFYVVKAAVKGDKQASEGEMFSYRTAFILLALTFVGAVGWAFWLNVQVMSVVLYFFFLVFLGMISARLRAECGTPFGYFTPSSAMLFMSLIGGMPVFGAKGMLICSVASFMFPITVFYLIPGAQLELAELGRKMRINPRHILYTCLIAIFGGIIIGGWVFLSNAYSLGGTSFRYSWAVDGKLWAYSDYNTAMSFATQKILNTSSNTKQVFDWSMMGYLYSGAVTLVLVVLRQLFAGFWFHPIGFVLGSSNFTMTYVWANALVAWGIRFAVLQLGGAATVRNKLVPFAIGVFFGAVAAYIIFWVYASILFQKGIQSYFCDLM